VSTVFLALLAVAGVLLLLGPVLLQAFVLSRAKRAVIVAEPVATVPGGGWPVAGTIQALGFTAVGAVRVSAPSVPDQHCILFANPTASSFARLWVGPDGKNGGYSFQSPLPFGALITGIDAVDAVTDGELLQVFPGADPQALLDHHLRAQWHLASLGVQGVPVVPAEAELRFRAEWDAEIAALASRGLGFTASLAYRSALKLPKRKGPLADQRDLVERLRDLQHRAEPPPPTGW
jgi:hypothetical protein